MKLVHFGFWLPLRSALQPEAVSCPVGPAAAYKPAIYSPTPPPAHVTAHFLGATSELNADGEGEVGC